MNNLTNQVAFLFGVYKGIPSKPGAYYAVKEYPSEENAIKLLHATESYLEEAVKYNSNRASRNININGMTMTDHEFGIRFTKANVIELIHDKDYFEQLKEKFPEILGLKDWEKYMIEDKPEKKKKKFI